MQKVTYFCSQRIKRGPSLIELVYFNQQSAPLVQLRSLGELAHEEERDAAEKLLRFYADNIFSMTGQMPVIHFKVGNQVSNLLNILKQPDNIDTPTWLVLPLEKATGSGRFAIQDLLFSHCDQLSTPIVLLPRDVPYNMIDMLY